ncbi:MULTISPECIES: hypothetical protein [unclassified Microcoleus]|uniref:hypothetical protein n=1 Tax=unclassified Microcoleus TaxID=2642155 RepID=UPI0025E41D4A|nr:MULTISPECIES: hypothetical protein [unclassified Microcoleus]
MRTAVIREASQFCIYRASVLARILYNTPVPDSTQRKNAFDKNEMLPVISQ